MSKTDIKGMIVTTNYPIRKRVETVNGKSYFRFSGKIDYIHLLDGNTALCGKPCLSSNYAQLKPKGIVCPDCEYEANKDNEEQ